MCTVTEIQNKCYLIALAVYIQANLEDDIVKEALKTVSLSLSVFIFLQRRLMSIRSIPSDIEAL